MADLFIPDVSEYQSVDFTVFTGPIIVRAHNSVRADNHWTRHADGAARQPWWGAYQYLTRNADAATAAHRMLDTIGARKPNVVIVDIEEGDGSQARRRVEWFDVIRSAGFCPWAYSGEAFARAHGLGDVDWIAAYRKTEPAAPHLLWQFADNHWFPGIGNCDGSIFHGTVDELIAATSGSPQPTPTPTPPPQEDDVQGAFYIRKSAPDPKPVHLRTSARDVVHVEDFADIEQLWGKELGVKIVDYDGTDAVSVSTGTGDRKRTRKVHPVGDNYADALGLP